MDSFTSSLSGTQIGSIFQIHPMSDNLSQSSQQLPFLSCISSLAFSHPHWSYSFSYLLCSLINTVTSMILYNLKPERHSFAQSCLLDYRVNSKAFTMTSKSLKNMATWFPLSTFSLWPHPTYFLLNFLQSQCPLCCS